MNVSCERFKEHVQGALQGFADLVIEPLGIRLHDCTFNHSADGGAEWVGLPSRQYQDAKGEKKYARLVDFSSRSAYYDFQKAAKDSIRQCRASAPQSSQPADPRSEISDSDIPF